VHLKTLARIVPLLTADAPPVRCAAAKGLGAFRDSRKKAVPALVAALGPNSQDPTVLAAILETLGKIGDASALPPIHKLFDEKDSRTAKAALEAAAGIGSSGSVDALLDQLKKLERQAKEDTTGGVNSGVGGQGGQNYNVPADDTARRRAQELLPVVNKTLQAITREKHGSYAEWQGWWARNRAQFKAEK